MMKAVIKAIYASARSIGLDQDGMRDFYQREVGKRGLTLMSNNEKYKVLDALRLAGAKSAPKGRKKLSGPYAKKLQALWISAYNLGIVQDIDDKAMLAFIKRQTGIENTAFLRDAADAQKVIEALKAWIAREAFVDWSYDKDRLSWANNPKYQVVSAQVRKLRQIGELRKYSNIFTAVQSEVKEQNLSNVNDREWIEVQQRLGKKIREAQKR